MIFFHENQTHIQNSWKENEVKKKAYASYSGFNRICPSDTAAAAASEIPLKMPNFAQFVNKNICQFQVFPNENEFKNVSKSYSFGFENSLNR